jgi:hypothetical protein
MAAGLGYIEFTTGDILTAASANGYLASQTVMVFADAAARTSAITSPQEGMVSYLKDTNAVEYYSGSAWVAVGGGGSSAGKVLQVVSTTKTDTFTSTSTSPVDVTGLSVSITPSSATSKVMVFVTVNGNGQNASNGGVFRLLRGSTDIAMPTSTGSRAAGFGSIFVDADSQTGSTSTNFLDSPATTSATTYKIQGFASSSGSFQVNRPANDADQSSRPRNVSSITVMEIGA